MAVIERGRLDDGRQFAVLEERVARCPLGVRFWDTVADDQIRAGLVVRAWPEGARRPIKRASRTRSDIYAFHDLPGLHDHEHPRPHADSGPVSGSPASPAPTHPFVVEVVDPERRYLPIAFRVDLPHPDRGVYLAQLPGSPSMTPPGFYLFSSPTRQRPPGVAAVRGELVHAVTDQPAGHALLRLSVTGQHDRWGLADSEGRFAIYFPLPPLAPGFQQLSASPSAATSPPGPPVAEREWDVSLSVFWEPARLEPLPGTTLPDYGRTLHQSPAEVISAVSSPLSAPEPEWFGTLGYDGELVAGTTGRTDLLIVTTGSPP